MNIPQLTNNNKIDQFQLELKVCSAIRLEEEIKYIMQLLCEQVSLGYEGFVLFCFLTKIELELIYEQL